MANTIKAAAKMTEAEFVLSAIEALRETEAYTVTKGPNAGQVREPSAGIHTVYSGFNAAFRAYFGKDADPVAATTALAESGVIEMQFVKGGAMIYCPGDAPERTDRADAALAKITAFAGQNAGYAAARRNGPVNSRRSR